MSPPERTNDSATKSASISTATSRSARSLSVIAGSVGRALVTDALARAERPARDDAGGDAAVLDALGEQARDAVADDDLRAVGDEVGEAAEVDADVLRAGRDLGAGERHGLADLHHALLGLGGQAQLRALQVEHERDRALRALGRRADLEGAPAQVVGAAVRAVQAGAVQAGRDELVEDPGAVGRRPERGDDLRVPREHGREGRSPSAP